MSRMNNIWDANKLARLHLTQAREDIAHQKTERALLNMWHALDGMLVTMNNVSSIAFHKKPKSKKPRSKK